MVGGTSAGGGSGKVVIAILFALTFLLVPVLPSGADATTAAPEDVFIRPPTEGTRIVLDSAKTEPVYRMYPYGAFPAGSIREHEGIILDGWDGRKDGCDTVKECTGKSHMLSAKTGLLFASGDSGIGRTCLSRCGHALQEYLFHQNLGTENLWATPLHLLEDLPESALWGHTVQAGEQWDLPQRHRWHLIYTGNVTVESLTQDALTVTLRTAYGFVGEPPFLTYEAQLTLPVEDGEAAPFATTRSMSEETFGEYAHVRTWSSVVAVVEEGTGPALPFEAQMEEDIWPEKDLSFDHGPSAPTPYDPRPHPFFDIGLTTRVILGYPHPAVTAFLAAGDLAGVRSAKVSVVETGSAGWPAHDVLFVGVWSVELCNSAGEILKVTMHGVQPRSGPVIPLTFHPYSGRTCDPDRFDTEQAALGDVLRTTEELTRDRLWQLSTVSYDGYRHALVVAYDHPRLDVSKVVKIRLEAPFIENAVVPRENQATQVLP